MQELRHSTLVFLIERDPEGGIARILLAMKKRGFGAGRYNGAGGKVEAGETEEEAARREVKEEIGVDVPTLALVGRLTFRFPHEPKFDQLVYVYLAEAWEGEPAESEEMRPKWFDVAEVPYREMWPDDQFWLPFTIAGEKVVASFVFGEGDVVNEQHVETVEEL
jgi:mutator protein MutT